MADQLYICNAALDLVGQGNILSIDDATPAAKKCKLHYRAACQEVLSLGKWRSAQKVKQLAQLSTTPATKWAYGYQLPADYLRMVRFNDTDADNYLRDVYDILGNQLVCNFDSVFVQYIADLTNAGEGNDISVAPPYLIELMAVKLAQKMVWGLQQSRTLKESLEQEYQQKRRMALAANAKETRETLPNPTYDSTWSRARFASTAG